MRRRRITPAVLLVALAAAPSAGAQGKKPAPTPAPASPPASTASASASAAPPASPAPAPAPARGAAIAQLAAEIAKAIGAAAGGALVAASPVTSDVPARADGKLDALAVHVAAQVASKLGGAARAHDRPVTLAGARGQAGRAASLVFLRIEIDKGEVRITADLYPVVSNGWERLRNPQPGPGAHAFASVPMDAEVRAFLAPVLLEQAAVHKAKHDEGEILAVGCGDLDGDGGMELALVSRARVTIAKVRGGKLIVQRSAPWAALAPRAPVPLREPLAAAVIRRGELLVGTTDRGGVVVDGSLVVKRALTGLPVAGAGGEACAVPSPEHGAFEGDAVACEPRASGEPPATLATPALHYDAIARLDAVGKDGAVTGVIAAREPSTGKLRIRRQGVELVADGVGAELALADLDLDGVPEVISSTEAEPDALVVSTLGPDGVTARLRFPAKAGIRALAVCPPEERGAPGLVAVVGHEVWLVR